MQKLLTGPVAIAVIAVMIVISSFWIGVSSLKFKAELLTQVMPSLLTTLFVIAAITERGVAVFNDIWFGEQRERIEDDIRLAHKKLEATRAEAANAQRLIQEAVRTGHTDILAQPFMANATNVMASPTQQITAFAREVSQSEHNLAAVQAEQTRARLGLAFIIALLVSAVGARALDFLFDTSALPQAQKALFQIIDILLTAGVLTGGTNGISAITELMGTYANVSRKRALERT
jgi:hypothetical protein